MGAIETKYVIDVMCGLGTLDVTTLLKLSDREFAEWYRGSMGEYIENHVKLNGHVPGCHDCAKPIETPENLRRYHGASLRRICFLPHYDAERRNGNVRERDIPYFDRVRDLRLEERAN
jgi:hypothetical protein